MFLKPRAINKCFLLLHLQLPADEIQHRWKNQGAKNIVNVLKSQINVSEE